MRINAKERDKEEREARREEKRKGIEAQKAKPTTPPRAIDALTEDEEENEKQKKEQK